MDRIEKMKYTIAHRKAFRRKEEELFGEVSLRGWLHDLDKLILYPILGVKLTSRLHRWWSRHHKRASTYSDYKQMVVDWECARDTKPDKPLDAYETLYEYYPELENEVIPIILSCGLDKGRTEWRRKRR